MSNHDELESIDDEVMVLESIYEELEVTRNDKNHISNVGITLFPATANNAKEQYVKLQLRFDIPQQYPTSPLNVVFLSSRGMSDQHLQKLKKLLDEHIQQSQNENLLFTLIEMAKDSLTSNNIPSDPCPICLFPFKKFDVYVKSECFHHMHSYCMFQYVTHYLGQQKQETLEAKKYHKHVKTQITDKKIPCPVCKALTAFDLETLKDAQEPIHNECSLNWNGIREQMQSMKKTYERQKQCGGLIDLEAEKNKHLLSSIEQAYAASSQEAKITEPVGGKQTNRLRENVGHQQGRHRNERWSATEGSSKKPNFASSRHEYRDFHKHYDTRQPRSNDQHRIVNAHQAYRDTGPRTHFKKTPNARTTTRDDQSANRDRANIAQFSGGKRDNGFPHSSSMKNFAQKPIREQRRETASKNVKRPPEQN